MILIEIREKTLRVFPANRRKGKHVNSFNKLSMGLAKKTLRDYRGLTN
jgi:hypothetical protein